MRREPHARAAIAWEAARRMISGECPQYYDAKRAAARDVLGSWRPRDLPSNGEIREALRALVDLTEGPDRQARLFAMRIVALDLLEALAGHHARLIGSVGSGHARRGSDIDIHVFPVSPMHLQRDLAARGWVFEAEDVPIRVAGDIRWYRHIHVRDRPFPVELSVYAPEERRSRPRSSTDGKPIDRMAPGRLRDRIQTDHPELWQAWLLTGRLELPNDAKLLEGGEVT